MNDLSIDGKLMSFLGLTEVDHQYNIFVHKKIICLQPFHEKKPIFQTEEG